MKSMFYSKFSYKKLTKFGEFYSDSLHQNKNQGVDCHLADFYEDSVHVFKTRVVRGLHCALCGQSAKQQISGLQYQIVLNLAEGCKHLCSGALPPVSPVSVWTVLCWRAAQLCRGQSGVSCAAI